MITFADVAAKAIQIDLDEPTYRHEDQMSSTMSEAGTITMWTPNGTQTFNPQGHPSDSDQD